MADAWFAHETACVDQPCQIGEATRIWHFCHIMRDVRIGARCSLGQNVFVASGVVIGNNVKIQNNVSLYTGVVVEDDVFLGPNVVFTNDLNPRCAFKKTREGFLPTLVRRGATIGANATIVCGVTVGEAAFIGAGSVVTRDVPPHALVVGNPARRRGWVCTCGEKLDTSLQCGCGRTYRDTGAGLLPVGP